MERFARHHVGKADGRQGDEAKVRAVDEAPILPQRKYHSANANIAGQYQYNDNYWHLRLLVIRAVVRLINVMIGFDFAVIRVIIRLELITVLPLAVAIVLLVRALVVSVLGLVALLAAVGHAVRTAIRVAVVAIQVAAVHFVAECDLLGARLLQCDQWDA